MKKNYYYIIIALAIFAISPSIIFAEDITSSVSNTSSTSSTSTKDRLRAVVNTVGQKVETKIQNVKTNMDVRNATIDARRAIATSTRAEISNIRMEMRTDIFNTQLNRLKSQLNISLNNLKQIRSRIDARITKAVQSGRDMSKAKDSLVIADNKITLAEQAINGLTSLQISTSTIPVNSTSTNIKLDKPRQVGALAIKAVNDARNALNDVVVSIAHSMGLKLGTATTTDNRIPPTASSSMRSTE
jgi:hypothetical protein